MVIAVDIHFANVGGHLLAGGAYSHLRVRITEA